MTMQQRLAIRNATVLIVGTLALLSYCAPAPAADCHPLSTDFGCLQRQYERDMREDRRDAEDRADRLHRRMEADREYEQRERHHDRTICQPGEDCRRTLWYRRGY